MWRSSYYDSVVAHYILIWFLTWVYGGQWRFENIRLNISKRHRIVTKFGTSVDGGKTQLFQVEIFDTCPQKFLAPLWIFRYHYGQWDRKFQTAIKSQGIVRSGWNFVHMWPTLAPSIKKFSRVGNSPNSKKVEFCENFQNLISRKRAGIFSRKFQKL